MKKTFLFSLILTCITLTGCSSDSLSKEEAHTVIQAGFKQNCEQDLVAYRTYYNGREIQRIDKEEVSNVSAILDEMKKLKQQGYISSYSQSKRKIDFNFTSKAKRLKSKKNKKDYIVAESEVIEVTAISENKETNTAIVRFKYKYNPLPLYVLRLPFKRQTSKNCTTDIQESEVTLVKFDTGWQIK